MKEKQVTLEELARAEAAALKEREKARKAYHEGQKLLVTEMPERFFTMTRAIRDGVRRFNETRFRETGTSRHAVRYEETVAVTTRDGNMGGDFHVELERQPNFMSLSLRTMARPGRPDVYLIEGHGSVGEPPHTDRFVIRIDAYCKVDGSIFYRKTCNFQEVDTPIEELPERMVIMIVTGELTRLWNTPPWIELQSGGRKLSV